MTVNERLCLAFYYYQPHTPSPNKKYCLSKFGYIEGDGVDGISAGEFNIIIGYINTGPELWHSVSKRLMCFLGTVLQRSHTEFTTPLAR